MLRSLLSLGGIHRENYVFPTVDPAEDGPDCKKDCADCTTHFPPKVKVETLKPLYGHLKPVNTHVLVATGKSDWKQHVEDEKGSLMEAFDRTSAKSKHGVLTSDDVKELVDCFIDAPQSSPDGKPASSRLPSRPCKYDYVVLLCSHKRRDARCGITAPLIKRELERHLRPLGLYRDADDERPGGVGIFFVSHVGGHKFSANVLIYRKKEEQLIWLARIKPEHCEGVRGREMKIESLYSSHVNPVETRYVIRGTDPR
ncbi:hypothetical protein EYZ11_012096 [Aspergillus tanneri]|uniref:Actin patches distal protein 1 n=1 Tax=Aspergillus tanneri TaxID=1220188 RepID=A0A4S3J1E0_9EURO|nr:hypothetical protein EYZ11_012096 [Aspergillus tanneri]